jgi:hypothetical protein
VSTALLVDRPNTKLTLCGVSTLKDIEDAIRALSPTDRAQLADDLPGILPELNGDVEWRRIISDARPRPALNALAESTEKEYHAHPENFQELTDENFEK